MDCVVLDTDLLIGLLRGETRATRFIDRLYREGYELYTTVVNLYELYRGALRRGQRHVEAVRELEQVLDVLPLDAAAARRAAEESERLRGMGLEVEIRDTLVAAIALRRGCGVATCNTRHFARFEALAVLRWC